MSEDYFGEDFSPEPPREVPSYWRPIATAPKDGSPMLLCRWDSNDQDVLPVVSGFWSRLSEGWFAEMAGHSVDPTHWMALPAPPKLLTLVGKRELPCPVPPTKAI